MSDNNKRKYRKIDSNIWNDERFNQLSDHGKLAFFFLLTHPYMTSLGAMRGSLKGLSIELGWVPESLTESLSLCLDERMLVYNEKASFLWLPNSLKYNPPESPNVVKAWAKVFNNLPECDEKHQLYQAIKGLLKGFDKAFNKAFVEVFPKDYAKPRSKEQIASSKDYNPPQQEEKNLNISNKLDKETGEIADFADGGF